MTIRMDEGAAELLDTLHRAGYAAYVVGGCVRDSLLGLTPHDWDLCTSALPQQALKIPNRVLFSRCKAIYWSYALPSKTQEPVGLFL